MACQAPRGVVMASFYITLHLYIFYGILEFVSFLEQIFYSQRNDSSESVRSPAVYTTFYTYQKKHMHRNCENSLELLNFVYHCELIGIYDPVDVFLLFLSRARSMK